jgi:transposase
MNRLQTIDADTLQSTAYEPVSFVVDDLLPQGLHLLAGAPKIGKSFFMAQLSYHVATGTSLWQYDVHPDMYPQYWTSGIGGIFMRYSYEYKKMCVELYRQGKWVETPEGVKEKNFRNMIRIWARTEESCGVEALRHKNQNKVWTAEEKYELVAKVLAGESNRTTAIAAGIDKGLLYSWVRCYKMKGYQGLVAQRQGRPPKEPDMRKKIEPTELTPSEREEMIRLRAENERLRAEIAVVKKEIALREERCAAQLKAKKLRSSKSSTKKDIN